MHLHIKHTTLLFSHLIYIKLMNLSSSTNLDLIFTELSTSTSKISYSKHHHSRTSHSESSCFSAMNFNAFCNISRTASTKAKVVYMLIIKVEKQQKKCSFIQNDQIGQ